MRRLPEAAGASAEVYNKVRGWLTGRIARPLEGLIKGKTGAPQPEKRIRESHIQRQLGA